MDDRTQSRAISAVLGAVIGAVVGAIVAVNVVIFSGIDEGYEATLPQVFEQNAAVGVLAVAALVAGPVLGTIVALRHRQAPPSPHKRRAG